MLAENPTTNQQSKKTTPPHFLPPSEPFTDSFRTVVSKAFSAVQINLTKSQLNRLCLSESNISSIILTQTGDSRYLYATWMPSHLSLSALPRVLFTYRFSQYTQHSTVEVEARCSICSLMGEETSSQNIPKSHVTAQEHSAPSNKPFQFISLC